MKTQIELKAMTIDEIQDEMYNAKRNHDGDYQTIVENIMIEKEMDILEGLEMVQVKGSTYKQLKGKVVKTTKKIYVIQKNGHNWFQVFKLDADGRWNRYFDVKRDGLYGGSGLPKVVQEILKGWK